MEIVLKQAVRIDLPLLDRINRIMQKVLDVRSIVQRLVVMGLDPVA